ncbi:MAG TPA: hypothetical protein VFB96_03415 [Pirellulaceae bacterium]|nr:hypothetical protein [Pirellulaceae bacterium]
MSTTPRREFLKTVGRGMLVAGLGASLAHDLGLASARAADAPAPLSFGGYDGLIDLMQSTPPEKLQPILIEKLNKGEADLKQLISAGALANAETFGGEDYVGFHTAMAMLPAWYMTDMLPSERRPLPILKVLYRNSGQIQAFGGADKKVLRQQYAAEEATVENVDLAIRDAGREGDVEKGEKLFAPLAKAPLKEMFNVLQPIMQDDINVHRFVFAYRTYGLADLLGKEHAYTILRQCVHFSCNHEDGRIANNRAESPIRSLMPRLLDQYKLAGKELGKRDPGDAAVEALAETIYRGPADRSAEAVAGALAEGISPEVVGEAISIASNLLCLRQGPDPWRTHGDSAGVHSSDATNAWRNMARIAEPRHAISGLIVAGYHVAVHTPYKGNAYPLAEHRAAIKATDQEGLLAEAEDAIRHNDQGRAAAAIAIFGEKGGKPETVYERMLKYTISEDGRLHGEKYFQTVQEEYKTTRQAFRWRQIVGLARVTASAFAYDREDKHGKRAPGYEDACKMLKVTA